VAPPVHGRSRPFAELLQDLVLVDDASDHDEFTPPPIA
jgi:hypothetical protein